MRVHFQHLTSQIVRVLRRTCAPSTASCSSGLRHGPSIDLYDDRWSASWRPTPAPTSPRSWRRSWVMPYNSPWFALPPLHWLRARGLEPRLELTSESFLTVPHLSPHTGWGGAGTRARLFLADTGTVVVDLPFEAGPWWSPCVASAARA
ncbi:hypothetical protein F3K40_45315 [Streptomyces sp. LBUM 1478]|nr:hypothetical protein [Streptomyces sp. LBUM 1478]